MRFLVSDPTPLLIFTTLDDDRLSPKLVRDSTGGRLGINFYLPVLTQVATQNSAAAGASVRRPASNLHARRLRPAGPSGPERGSLRIAGARRQRS